MGTTRTLAAVGAVIFAGVLIGVPARAEPSAAGSTDVVGAPLNLAPPGPRTRTLHRPTAAKKPQRTLQRRAAPVHAATRRQHGPAVVRGRDGIGLIAMLPWWRASELQTIHYQDREAESPVLTAADAWLAWPNPAAEAPRTGDGMRLASANDVDETGHAAYAIRVADPNELNEIDLAAGAPPPADKSWLHALIALLGGALAAASMARLLFV